MIFRKGIRPIVSQQNGWSFINYHYAGGKN